MRRGTGPPTTDFDYQLPQQQQHAEPTPHLYSTVARQRTHVVELKRGGARALLLQYRWMARAASPTSFQYSGGCWMKRDDHLAHTQPTTGTEPAVISLDRGTLIFRRMITTSIRGE